MKHALTLIPAIATDAVVDGAVRAGGGLALAWRRTGAWWRAQIVRGTATTAAIALLLAVVSVIAVDRPVAEAVRDIGPELHAWLNTLTQLGDSAGYIVVGAVLTLALAFTEVTWPALGARWRLTRWLRRAAYFTAAVVVSGLAAILVKFVVGRPRPRMWFGDESAYAFRPFTFDSSADFASIPSGHTTTIVAAAVALMMIFGRRMAWIVLPVALLVAATRILLTAHYVGDTIAAAILGGLTAMVLAPLFDIGPRRPSRPGGRRDPESPGGLWDEGIQSGAANEGETIDEIKAAARAESGPG